jgi:adenylosuccinate lyase
MIEGPAGTQWNEGDVSCSVVRRVALSGAFFAIDGALETWMTVLDKLGIYESMVERELERNMPFLATTKILMAALQAGITRERAHKIIKKHATQAVDSLRGKGNHTFYADLGGDESFPLDEQEILALIGSPLSFAGLATEQVQSVVKQVEAVCEGDWEATNYQPEPIL